MGAIKAARAYTGRPMIAKVEGAYHGTYDHAETSLGAGPADWGTPPPPPRCPTRPGPAGLGRCRGGRAAVQRSRRRPQRILDRCGARLAAVLIDTLPSRVGMPSPDPEFLAAVTATAREVGALVILDEVISFRLGPAGNQGRLDLEPDLTALGKIIGGGFPVGAVAGRAEVMAVFEAVDGARARVPSGGTFSANSVTMVAGPSLHGPADRCRLRPPGRAGRAGPRRLPRRLRRGRARLAGHRGGLAVPPPPPRAPDPGLPGHPPHARRGGHDGPLQHRLLERGVYLSSYGMGCLSLAMTDADVDHLVGAVADTLHACRSLARYIAQRVM